MTLVAEKDEELKRMVYISLYSMLEEARQYLQCLNWFFPLEDTANEHTTYAKLSDEIQNNVDVIF